MIVTEHEISNNSLLEKISIEFVVGLVAMLVTVGITWGTLATRVEAMEEDLTIVISEKDSISAVQQEVKEEVGFLRTDVAVIKNNQAHFREKIEDIDKNLDQILAELRARP